MITKDVYDYAVEKNNKYKAQHTGIGYHGYESIIEEYELQEKRINNK